MIDLRPHDVRGLWHEAISSRQEQADDPEG